MGINKFNKPLSSRKKYYYTEEEENEIVELALRAVDKTWGAWSLENRKVIEEVIREGLKIGREDAIHTSLG